MAGKVPAKQYFQLKNSTEGKIFWLERFIKQAKRQQPESNHNSGYLEESFLKLLKSEKIQNIHSLLKL